MTARTLQHLQSLGFTPDNIVQQKVKQGQVEYDLLRASKSRRIYNISLLSASQLYLSVSYDAGRRFGKAARFNRLETLLQMISGIEKREAVRDVSKPLSSEEKQNIAGALNSDQQSGLGEAKSRAKKEKQRQKQQSASKSASDKLTSSAKAIGGAGSGSASGSEVEQATRSAASGAAGGSQNCDAGGPQGGADRAPQGGVAQATAQIGEAALVSLLGGGLGESTETGVAGSSAFFRDSQESLDVRQLMQDQQGFTGAQPTQKALFLRTLLANIVQDQQDSFTRQYPTLKQEWERLRSWASAEKIPSNITTARLLRAIAQIEIEKAPFAKLQQWIPEDQQRLSFSAWQQLNSWGDPHHDVPAEIATDFLALQLLRLKGEQLNLPQQIERYKSAQHQWLSAHDGPFASNTEERNQAGVAVASARAAMLKSLETLRLLAEQHPLMPHCLSSQCQAMAIAELDYPTTQLALQQLPNESPQSWLLSKATAKHGCDLVEARQLDMIPTPLIQFAVLRRADKVALSRLAPDAMNTWNQCYADGSWALNNHQAIQRFPGEWLTRVAPGERPRWLAKQEVPADLNATSLARLQRGWGYEAQTERLQLHFFSQNQRRQWRAWHLTVSRQGLIYQVKSEILE